MTSSFGERTLRVRRFAVTRSIVMMRTSSIMPVLMSMLVCVILLCAIEQSFALTVISPQENQTFQTTIVDVLYGADSSPCAAWLDDGARMDFTTCDNFTVVAKQGENVLRIQDATSTQNVTFTVQTKTQDLTNIPSPTNNDNVTGTLNETYAELPQDDISSIDALFDEHAVTNGPITVGSERYDYPPGVSFTVYVKVKNVGNDAKVTLVPAMIKGNVESIRRVDEIVTQRPVAYPIKRRTTVQRCEDGVCDGEILEEIIDVKQQVVKKIDITDRALISKKGMDERVSRVRNARDRAPKESRAISADDIIDPGTEAIYALTLRAPTTRGVDEFFFHAVSSDMAVGIDPYSDTNWSYMRPVVVNETFYLNRTKQMVYLNLSGFGTEQLHNCTEEIRVANITGADVPTRVVIDGGNLSSNKFCAIIFGTNIVNRTSTTFYVFYGNPNATAPAAATNKNLRFNLTWTPSAVYFPTTDFGLVTDASDNLAPSIVDYDCDGKNDILYGLDDGITYWRRNTGSNAVPIWAAAAVIIAAGGRTFSAPEMALLFNNDGLNDMGIGYANGFNSYYFNNGTCNTPAWVNMTVANGSFDFGGNTKLAQADFNSDGLIDFVVGNNTGNTTFITNYNTTTKPAFYIRSLPPLRPNVGGTLASPSVADFNFDDLPDIIVGNTAGNVRLYYNNGTSTVPDWLDAGLQIFNSSKGNIDALNDAVPATFDINGDGWEDLIIGERIGFITANNSNVSGLQGTYLVNAPLNTTIGDENVRPVIQSLTITPGYPITNETLNCTINITDVEQSNVTVNFTWYRNSTLVNMNSTVVCENNTLCTATTLPVGENTTVTENWRCDVDTNDTFWSTNDQVNVTIRNAPPNISLAVPGTAVTLTAGSTTRIVCNMTVMDIDNITTVNVTNASIYLMGTGPNAIDSNVSHYTNRTCNTTGNSSYAKNFTCTFTLLYYTGNGSWVCNATINDTWNISFANKTFNVSALYALNITPTIVDFGNVSPGNESENKSVAIYNLGNQALNISLSAYGQNNTDGKSFICDTRNLSISRLRYSTSITASFLQKNAIIGTLTTTNITVPAQTSPTLTLNTTYWQVSVLPPFPDLDPSSTGVPNSMGLCYGNITFQAESNT